MVLLLAGCASSGVTSLAGATLTSTSRQVHSAQDLVAAAPATVFVFWSAGCPCVRRYQERIEALAAAWRPRGIAFVQVSSNAGETLESLTLEHARRGLALPVWRDEGGQLAQELQARSTPTVVFVGRDGTVLFRGWVDNERTPGEPDREAWLEAALTGFTRGEAFASHTPTWGCTITRSLGLATTPSCHQPSPGETP